MPQWVLGMDKQEKKIRKLVGLDPSDYECCIQWGGGGGALKFAMCTQNAKKGLFF